MFTHQMHSMLTNTVDRLRDRDLLLAEEVSMSIANPKTDFFELPLLRWELGWKTKSWSSLKNEDDDLNSNFSSNVTRRKGPKLKHLFVFSIREREKEREKERKREREREREREEYMSAADTRESISKGNPLKKLRAGSSHSFRNKLNIRWEARRARQSERHKWSNLEVTKASYLPKSNASNSFRRKRGQKLIVRSMFLFICASPLCVNLCSFTNNLLYKSL